ncbi:hypothetical protein AB4402_11020 [Vibrio breoganii]
MELLERTIKEDLLKNADWLAMHVVETIDKAYIPGGNNGPYLHIESPIRNTCHAIVCFRFAYLEKFEVKYLALIEKCVSYLYHSRFRSGYRFLHRQAGPDSCNGIIGDAWILESLVSLQWLSDKLSEKCNAKVDKLVKLIIDNITINNDMLVHDRNDYYKGKQSPDYTYNHQLWLYASLVQVPKFRQLVSKFLYESDASILKIRQDGLIYHLANVKKGKNLYNLLRYEVSNIKNPELVSYKERGYQLFNLFAFAKIYQCMPDHDFFQGEKFNSILGYITKEFIEKLHQEDNKYAIHYNAPAFELPFIAKTFFQYNIEMQSLAFDTYNKAKDRFSIDSVFINNDLDTMTYLCRVYELTYFLDK